MTVTVQNIIDRAARIANDVGKVTWPQAEWLDWFNEGVAELITLHTDAHTETVELTLVAGAKQTAPAGSVEILDVRQVDGGNAVTLVDRNVLDRFAPDWMVRPVSSTVKHWLKDQHPNAFYVYPAQGSAPATLVVTHASIPQASLATDAIPVREIYAANMTNYLLYRAYSKDSESGNADRAMAAYKLFTGG